MKDVQRRRLDIQAAIQSALRLDIDKIVDCYRRAEEIPLPEQENQNKVKGGKK